MDITPFGDGGADPNPNPRLKVYTHGPCASPIAREFVVPCGEWKQAPPDSAVRRELAVKVLETLREHGFVVLEHLYSAEDVAPIELEAIRHMKEPQAGWALQPLRADRTNLQLPFALPWANDWLVKNELILEVAARYCHNNLAGGRTQDEQQWALVEWLTAGADLDWFLEPHAEAKPGELLDDPPEGCSDVGSAWERGPWFGRGVVTRTPPGSPPQRNHRDINFPGPTAQLTVQVALTQLMANNGPLGWIPGSHRMRTPGFEVVANPPLGSVVLYDSFTDHRGIENHSSRDRYAMYWEFETRGVYGGYTDSHFGDEAVEHALAFRKAVDPELRRWVAKVG